MAYIGIKIMRQSKILLIIPITVFIVASCNRNMIYNEVYCKLRSTEKRFYDNKSKDIEI